MKNDRLFEILCNFDESFIEEAESITVIKSKNRNRHLPFKILAACLCLILISAAVISLFDIPSNLPFLKPTVLDDTIIIEYCEAPQTLTYYGRPYTDSEDSGNDMLFAEEYSPFASMIVRLIETLPYTYTFYDCPEIEYMLLKMEIQEVLRGNDLPNEFYYLIPEGCFTDFSIYDCFIIEDVVQYGYDYSVMYNTAKNCPEKLDMILLGAYNLPLVQNGGASDIIAFDTNGNLDSRLYESTDGFKVGTGWDNKETQDRITKEYGTLEDAKNTILEYSWSGYDRNDFFTHTYSDFSREAQQALEYVKNTENGLFIPQFKNYTKSSYVYKDESVLFRRYIDGSATNETITIYPNKVEYTTAHFDSAELISLPYLFSAYSKICDEYEAGNITPPHIEDFEKMKNTDNGIFSWYAKTDKGVVGIVKISWTYTYLNNIYLDDKYYIIEPLSTICKPIDNHSLIEIFGEYESTYIYKGEYDNQGKIIDKSDYFTLK